VRLALKVVLNMFFNLCTYPVCKSKEVLKGIWNVIAPSLYQSLYIAYFYFPDSLIPKPTTRPLVELFYSSPLFATYFPNIYLVLSSHLLLRLQSDLFQRYLPQNYAWLLSVPMQATCAVDHLTSPISYLNCIDHTLVLLCLKFSQMHVP
jgi:hypothetical protein